MTRAATALLALALAAGLLASADGAGELELVFRIEPDPVEPGSIRVRGRIQGGRPGELVLRAALGDRALGLSGFSAECAGGAALEWSARRAPTFSAREPARTEYALALPPTLAGARFDYAVRPPRVAPATGEPETRLVGVSDERGLAVSLASMLLVPVGRPARLRIELDLPAGWQVLRAPPACFESTAEIRPLDHAIVACAGPSAPARALPSLSLASLPPFTLASLGGATDGAGDAGERIAAELERWLGPPFAPIDVLLLPTPAEGAVELPGSLPFVALDLDPADVGSLRRLVRHLVPRWFGRELRELSASDAPGDWFLLGLCEYLALRVPADAGLTTRDWRAALESTLAIDPELAQLDPRAGPDHEPTRAYARRVAAALAVHALALEAGGTETLLARLRQHGWPVDADGAIERTALDAPGSLDAPGALGRLAEAVRAEWSLALAPHAPSADAARPIDATVLFSFTADLEGKLENCGCKMSQSGGLARLVAATARLRALGPPVFAFDLGHFSGVEPGETAQGPTRARELELLAAMLGEIGCDAVAPGPDEWYAGHPALRAGGAALGLPLVAAGLRIDGERKIPAGLRVERGGLSVGFVGFSERMELGAQREQHERNARGVEFASDPSEALAALRELRPEVDLLVLGGRMRPSTLRALCAGDVRVDVALVAGLRWHPDLAAAAAGFLGETLVAADRAGSSGQNVLTLFLSADRRVVDFRSERRVLGQDAAEDARVRDRIDRLYEELDPALLLGAVRSPSAGDAWQRDDYAGASACESCHAAEFAQWAETPHALALESLAEVGRDRRPSCVACHVLGLGTRTGFQLGRPDPRLAGVQCETCHGAGGEHVRSAGRAPMRPSPEPELCLACHDAEHAEQFEAHLSEKLAAVRHGGRIRAAAGAAQPVR